MHVDDLLRERKLRKYDAHSMVSYLSNMVVTRKDFKLYILREIQKDLDEQVNKLQLSKKDWETWTRGWFTSMEMVMHIMKENLQRENKNMVEIMEANTSNDG
jgi:hypothetical protein